MKNISPQILAAQQTSGGIKEKKFTVRHVIKILLEMKGDNKILEAKKKDTTHTEKQ